MPKQCLPVPLCVGNLGPGGKITSGELFEILVEEDMNVKFADANDYLPSSLIKHPGFLPNENIPPLSPL